MQKYSKERINFLLEWLYEKDFFVDLREGFIHVNNFTVDLDKSLRENDMEEIPLWEFNEVTYNIRRVIERAFYNIYGEDIFRKEMFQIFKNDGVYSFNLLKEDLELPKNHDTAPILNEIQKEVLLYIKDKFEEKKS